MNVPFPAEQIHRFLFFFINLLQNESQMSRAIFLKERNKIPTDFEMLLRLIVNSPY